MTDGPELETGERCLRSAAGATAKVAVGAANALVMESPVQTAPRRATGDARTLPLPKPLPGHPPPPPRLPLYLLGCPWTRHMPCQSVVRVRLFVSLQMKKLESPEDPSLATTHHAAQEAVLIPQRLGNCSNSGPTTLSTTISPQLAQLPEHQQAESTAALDETGPMNAPDAVREPDTLPPVEPPLALPSVLRVSPPAQQPRNFRWGPFEGEDFCSIISNTYEEVIHWRRNVFLVPSGSIGKAFVSEVARLFRPMQTALASNPSL